GSRKAGAIDVGMVAGVTVAGGPTVGVSVAGGATGTVGGASPGATGVGPGVTVVPAGGRVGVRTAVGGGVWPGSSVGVIDGVLVGVGDGVGVKVSVGAGVTGCVMSSTMIEGLPPTRYRVRSRGSEFMRDGSRLS